ncbi:pilus assembly protein CpaE [Salinihabitans flavidus]|uniref:Pilus assembly protein CpaE n=1 Tax=Salinihabitans flavidus TaxID=569882 RepID=A0A1H8VTJ0_9RHOB|nr:AAA family ATPase [Salinihabitans flavidus]SEP18742.1 pilus assembly protein CpaE [Salinihabitans flavidus]
MKHAAILINEGPLEDPRETPSGARVPHLSAAAFCLTAATRGAIERASGDRRLTRVKTEVSDGGIAQVCRIFETRRTPSLLVIEIATTGEPLLRELDALAEICDPETKVVLIGTQNDIGLYRTLMERGIAEYLVGTITPLAYVATVQRLFAQEAETKLGKVFAFIGANGGVGASTLAQNVAWTIAEEQASPTLLLDLDFRFGSAAVNLDLKSVMGLEKYIGDVEKLDAALLDQLIVRRGKYLSVLPGFDDALCDVETAPDAIERLIEIARTSFPYVVLDLPHDWSLGSLDALTLADEVIVVASPDLPNLRNARAIMERLRALRPNDAPTQVVLNTCRMPRRKEIPADKFAKGIDVLTCATITFDPATFGAAATDGRTIREQAPRSKAQGSVRDLAQSLTGRGKTRRRGRLRRLLGFD